MARAETPVIEGRNRTVLVRSPFLHDLESTVYSPLSGVSLERGSEANAVLSGIASGAVSNAVNMPSLSAEEARRLGPYMKLAEQLGSFAGQLTETGIRAVAVEYVGAIAELNV